MRVSLGESQGAHEFGGQWANQEARVLIRAVLFGFRALFSLCFVWGLKNLLRKRARIGERPMGLQDF